MRTSSVAGLFGSGVRTWTSEGGRVGLGLGIRARGIQC